MFSTQPYDHASFDAALAEHAPGVEITYYETALHADTAALAADHRAVCAFVNDRLDAPTLEALAGAGVELVALRSAGFNHVDLDAAARRGLRVVRVPAYDPHAVAEHAMALMLTLNRKTHKAYNRIREGNFSLVQLTGFTLHGKTVGVVGTGKIGAAFCRIALGFGCRVLASDPHPSDELRAAGVTFVRDLDALLAESDIVSLHCPLTPVTQYLIGPRTLPRMRRGAMLINTSRGGLVDTEAAIEALKTGHLGYLGIDVYEQEEGLFFRDLSEHVITDDELLRLNSLPNVLMTAHQAYLTREALAEIAAVTLGNLAAFAAGAPLRHEIELPESAGHGG